MACTIRAAIRTLSSCGKVIVAPLAPQQANVVRTSRGSRGRRWWPAAIAGAVAVVVLFWWMVRATPVTVVAPARGTAAEIVYATGAVEPVRWAKVASVVRDRIVDLCYCEGKMVAKGDIMVRLDDRQLRAQVEELKAREEWLKREHARVSELVKRNVATTQALERATSDLHQVQALISVQMEKLADYAIAAPMDGLVLRRDGEIGEIAEPGQILFRIGEPKPLQVVAEVNEEDIPRVAVGQKVLLRTDAFPDRPLPATVREVTPMGDPVAKTYRIRASLPDDTPLLVGMSVEANIVTREKEGALLVPVDALQGGEVFVVDGSRVRRRAVTVGIRGTRTVEIISGVTGGERVVAPVPPGLVDGRRVRIVAGAASSR